jgi:hypothetical protein
MITYIQKYHQAAFTYVGIGVVIVILTMVFIPEAHHRSGIVPLLIGIVVLLGLAYFLYRGVRWLAILLCLFAVGRSCWWIYSFFTFADEDIICWYGQPLKRKNRWRRKQLEGKWS